MTTQDVNSVFLKAHERRGPIAWMAAHSVSANLLMVVLLLGGLFLGLRIKKEVFPKLDDLFE